ncbi:MAG: hypothetical protein M3461_20400, partial [Pseudomonadota bacterium]|nr:hypothetical protein [Pseudomonadota bacterium]
AYIIGKNCVQFFTVEPEPLLPLCTTPRPYDIHLVGLRRSLVRILLRPGATIAAMTSSALRASIVRLGGRE